MAARAIALAGRDRQFGFATELASIPAFYSLIGLIGLIVFAVGIGILRVLSEPGFERKPAPHLIRADTGSHPENTSMKLTSVCDPCVDRLRTLQWRKGAFTMALGPQTRRPTLLAAALALVAVVGASPARADRCDDIAKELKNQIDGLKISMNTGNMVYLTHPAAKELSIGCRGRNYSIELYAKGDRKPKPEFLALVGSMAAIVFTVTKDDTTTGSTRCLKRLGILRGDKIVMRYRRLNMECTRTKTEASIAMTRGKDE